MRILVVSNFYPPHSLGGYEQHCRDVVDGLRGRGHEVEVLCSTYGVDRPVREGHVERRLPSRWDPRYGKLTRRKVLADELKMNRAVREAIRRFRPELVSVWNLASIPYTAVAAAQRNGLPVVLHIDDDWPLRPDPWLSGWSSARHRWDRAVKTVARPLVDRVLPTEVRFAARDVHWSFISEYRKRQHVAQGLAPDDSPVLYAGIPVERFLGRPRAGRAAGPTRLLFVGALTPAKGPNVAIEALSRLAGEGHADVTLSLIGPPLEPYAESLAALARRLGLGEKVRFREPVQRWQMPEVYAEHDVFLFTSVAPESFPLTILEAMASGLPVVSSVTGGHAEILRDGENVLTYPSGDADELARRVRSLLDRPEEARRLAEAGQQLVRREFALERMIDQNERLFRQVLGQRAA